MRHSSVRSADTSTEGGCGLVIRSFALFLIRSRTHQAKAASTIPYGTPRLVNLEDLEPPLSKQRRELLGGTLHCVYILVHFVIFQEPHLAC